MVLFGIALFLHAVVDGLVIGIFKSVEQVAVIGFSIALHKMPIAVTLGFLFARSNFEL